MVVLRAFVALSIRIFILCPSTVWLILMEASYLNPIEETLVYSEDRKSFVTARTLFLKIILPMSPKRARKLLTSTCLWLVELHVKKCLLQISVEASLFAIMCLIL